MLYQVSKVIVQLPRYLNASGPVVGVGNWGIPTFGQTSGFRIKNQIHRLSVSVKKGMNKSTEEDRFDKKEL
tara:strand:- start:20389 stop:20601 length:213 start_codon:yes stop_codon:yes gene_type:complete